MTTESRARLRQALTDCHLACADAVRALDAEQDNPTDWWDKVNLDPEVIKERSSEPPKPEERGIEPFGLDNDHL